MNNKILYIILLSLSMIAYGQVGINTDTATVSQTLDVNGGMRIGELGTPDPNSIPLAIDNTTKQVIKATNETTLAPFHIVTFKMNISQTDSDWIEDADLKINANEYNAFITQAYLVKTNDFDRNDPARSAVFMLAQARELNGTTWGPIKSTKFNHWGDKGYLTNSNGDSLPANKEANKKPIYPTYSLENVQLKVINNSYHISCDYEGAGSIGNNKLTWFVDVLIIKKNLVKVIE